VDGGGELAGLVEVRGRGLDPEEVGVGGIGEAPSSFFLGGGGVAKKVERSRLRFSRLSLVGGKKPKTVTQRKKAAQGLPGDRGLDPVVDAEEPLGRALARAESAVARVDV